jgi:hypothetical protein
MVIKNRAELGFTPLRRSALDIIEVGIKAVLPSVVLPTAVTYDMVVEHILYTLFHQRKRYLEIPAILD